MFNDVLYLSHVTHQEAVAVLDVGQLLGRGLLIVGQVIAVLGVHKRLVLVGLVLPRSSRLDLGRSTRLTIRCILQYKKKKHK